MGQQEVFTFLKKNRNGWFTARQIAEKLKASFGSVTASLKRLRQSKQIKYKFITIDSCAIGKRKIFAYKFKW